MRRRGAVGAKGRAVGIVLMAILGGAALLVTLGACKSPVPHLVWRKEDAPAREVNPAGAAGHVLIAARASEYKEEVVALVCEELKQDDAHVLVTGVGALADHSADNYEAVLIINTAMAWTLDPEVQSFIDRFPDHDTIVVFTTSGDGGWLPEETDAAYDAVSGASDMATTDEKAAELAELVRGRL
jgi:hypothetical protein